MTTAQNKRLSALEKAAPTQTEHVEVIYTIVRPDRSIASHLLRTPAGLVELAPGDPRLEGYEPATPEINGGFRPGEEPGGYKSRL
jgi:hypothetical protein